MRFLIVILFNSLLLFRRWLTWLPKPPIQPSSTVIIILCFLAIFIINSSSRGLAKRASTMVTLDLNSFSYFAAASIHALSLLPIEIMAISLPLEIILPLPNSIGLKGKSSFIAPP